jgi:hypothetical protein
VLQWGFRKLDDVENGENSAYDVKDDDDGKDDLDGDTKGQYAGCQSQKRIMVKTAKTAMTMEKMVHTASRGYRGMTIK